MAARPSRDSLAHTRAIRVAFECFVNDACVARERVEAHQHGAQIQCSAVLHDALYFFLSRSSFRSSALIELPRREDDVAEFALFGRNGVLFARSRPARRPLSPRAPPEKHD